MWLLYRVQGNIPRPLSPFSERPEFNSKVCPRLACECRLCNLNEPKLSAGQIATSYHHQHFHNIVEERVTPNLPSFIINLSLRRTIHSIQSQNTLGGRRIRNSDSRDLYFCYCNIKVQQPDRHVHGLFRTGPGATLRRIANGWLSGGQ